jgi:DNA-binding response OmpR family regulator
MPMQKKLLVVDDEEDFCKLMVLMLQQEPLDIQCAFTLKDAAQKLEEDHPAILLLDNNLPDGKGIDFLIHSKKEIPVDHVILISADPSEQLKQKALDAGVLFLEKPFGLNKIREMIKGIS